MKDSLLFAFKITIETHLRIQLFETLKDVQDLYLLKPEQELMLITAAAKFNVDEKNMLLNLPENMNHHFGLSETENNIIIEDIAKKVLNEFIEQPPNILEESNYYEESILQSILSTNQHLLFDNVKQIKEYFGLAGTKKQYADEYLKYICYIIAGAILLYKLNLQGCSDDDDETKRVFRAVYRNSLIFVKKFVTSTLITFKYNIILPNFLEEEGFILIIHDKYKEYSRDIKHFFETNEACYVDEQVDDDFDDDDEDGNRTYLRKIQYIFIREMLELEFGETQDGISIDFSFSDPYDDYNLDDSIAKTLHCLKTLADN
jgi:hypothetical protein